MASIIPIGGKWRAQVRRRGHRAMTRTFDTRREAEAWARRVESGIEQGAAALDADTMTVAELLRRYREMRADLGRAVASASNTHYMLQHLEEDLGVKRVRDLDPQSLARWARMRLEQGAGGYTINMELSALGTAIRHTAAYLRITLPDVVGLARPILHYGQLISGGERRTRRPTEDELARLLVDLDARQPVVADAVRVAAVTGLRRGELARIAWEDLDELRRAVLVRQRKHPRRIEARDEWVPLPGGCLGCRAAPAEAPARAAHLPGRAGDHDRQRHRGDARPGDPRPPPARHAAGGYVAPAGTGLRRRRPEGRDGSPVGRGSLSLCGGFSGVAARAVRRCSARY